MNNKNHSSQAGHIFTETLYMVTSWDTQLKNDTFERVEEGGLREASWLPKTFSTYLCQTGFSNTLSACTWNQYGSNLFFFKKNIETVLRERQTVYVPLLFMNDSAGTTWNRDGPLLPPHPEGAWSWRCTPGGLWCSVSLCQIVWGNERWKDIELWMIFISQFTDEREKHWISIQGMSCEWRRKSRGKREANRRVTAPPHHPENALKNTESTNVTSHISGALVHVEMAVLKPVWHSVNIFYCICMLYAYL